MKTSPKKIPLPFTRDSVLQVLKFGASPASSPFTHWQIAEWCYEFWREYLEIDAPKEIEKLLPTLTDVDCQWDLYLANTYSLKDLSDRDSFDDVMLPTEWFETWLQQVS